MSPSFALNEITLSPTRALSLTSAWKGESPTNTGGTSFWSTTKTLTVAVTLFEPRFKINKIQLVRNLNFNSFYWVLHIQIMQAHSYRVFYKETIFLWVSTFAPGKIFINCYLTVNWKHLTFFSLLNLFILFSTSKLSRKSLKLQLTLWIPVPVFRDDFKLKLLLVFGVEFLQQFYSSVG